MPNKRIQVFKSATNVSILDIQSALNYHQQKEQNFVYKGNIIFIINEYGGSKEQLQAFMAKGKTKMVMQTIQNHMFHHLYPNGITDYGGTRSTQRARVLNIRFEADKQRFVFQIDEGQGRVGRNGAINMTKREKSVRTYLALEDALIMATEVLDFIRHQEMISLMKNDQPLYSYSYFQTNRQSNNQFNQQPQSTQNTSQQMNNVQSHSNQQQIYNNNNLSRQENVRQAYTAYFNNQKQQYNHQGT